MDSSVWSSLFVSRKGRILRSHCGRKELSCLIGLVALFLARSAYVVLLIQFQREYGVEVIFVFRRLARFCAVLLLNLTDEHLALDLQGASVAIMILASCYWGCTKFVLL